MAEQPGATTPASTNLAARMGLWSARHRKFAIFGWFGALVLVFVLGGIVGTKTLSDADAGVGESGLATQIYASGGFDSGDPESVLIQSSRLTAREPAFLAAVNRLGHLADVLYTDGGMGLGFELQAKAVQDLVQTTFILNGERMQYYNQKESWRRFDWPGRSDYPGVSLSWTSVRTGERLFGDYYGAWGLIRLLEQARVTPLDDSDTRFRIVLTAPDQIPLTWHLRTELGAGPLALLTLRGFSLPSRIFLADNGQATNGGVE